MTGERPYIETPIPPHKGGFAVSELLIRRATQADADAVERILREGKAAIAELGISQWQSDAYPSHADVARDIAEGASYLAEDETGTPLGTISLSFGGDATYDAIEGAWLTASTSTDARYATIHRTAVCRAAARRGVMSALFAEAERLSRTHGAESLRADTHPGNIPMRRLLERMGFTACGTIQLLRDDPDPARVAYEKLIDAAMPE